MSGYRRQLPTMTSLVVFEAAARHGSFTKAAGELEITQAAVSRQVQALEEALRLQLFRRLHRSIELTARGHSLAKTMSEALGLIAHTVQGITAQTKPAELVISASVRSDEHTSELQSLMPISSAVSCLKKQYHI